MIGADRVAKTWDQIKGRILKNSNKYVVFIKGSPPAEAKGQTKIQVQMRLSPDHLEAVLREAGLLGNETVRLLPLVQFAESQGSRYLWWADFSDSKQTTLAQGYSKSFFNSWPAPLKVRIFQYWIRPAKVSAWVFLPPIGQKICGEKIKFS